MESRASASMSLEPYDRWDGWSWRDGCWAASLCASSEWNLDLGYGKEEEEKGGELGGGGVGSKRGCEASGLKWDFHLFIYLAELIAQGCLLAFCCMFCGLSAPFPLLPPSSVFLMWVDLQVQICVCVYVRSCTFTPLLLLPVFVWLCMCANAVWVRLFCVSQQCLLLHATVITAYVFICKKWESVLAVQGWMVSFGIDLFYYVFASHAVQLSHTQAKATYPSCWRAQCPKTAQIMPRSENKSCFVLLFFFFTSSHWHFHQPH